MADVLKTVLLLALPASGKSEVRRYLAQLSREVCARDFHMGPTVQLDDFPYVHLMRRIDDDLAGFGQPRVFFKAPDRPFIDPRDWGTLIELLNEDHADLLARRRHPIDSAAPDLLARLDAAGKRVGLQARLTTLDGKVQGRLTAALDAEARAQVRAKESEYPDSLEGKTLVVEFARGGPRGSLLLLPEPYGYRYSLSRLSPALLEDANILYVWVTPEESRRKNAARTDPNDPGSILHHGVPEAVMREDYGSDDMDWLETNTERPGTVTVKTHGATFHLPIGRFDNRVDKTSFLRDDSAAWNPEAVARVHAGLKAALDRIAARR